MVCCGTVSTPGYILVVTTPRITPRWRIVSLHDLLRIFAFIHHEGEVRDLFGGGSLEPSACCDGGEMPTSPCSKHIDNRPGVPFCCGSVYIAYGSASESRGVGGVSRRKQTRPVFREPCGDNRGRGCAEDAAAIERGRRSYVKEEYGAGWPGGGGRRKER